MRPITTILPTFFLALAFVSPAAHAEDKPKQSPEMQVLNHIAGTWKVVVTTKAGDQESTETHYVTRTWSSDGQFLLEEDRAAGTQGVWTYDPDAKTYRFVLLARNWGILCNGQWNEKTKTLTIRGFDHAGNTFNSPNRIINKDYFESATVMKNADGNVIAELTHKQTRVKANAAAKIDAAKNDGDKLKQSPELKVFDRFVGTWKQVLKFKAGERTGTQTGVRTRAWSRGGKGNFLVEEQTTQPGDAVKHGVWTYDPDSKLYRLIFMGRNHAVIVNGAWDDLTKTMTWRHVTHDGGSGVGVHRFIDADHAEWSTVIKNAGGDVVWEGSAKQTRIKKTATESGADRVGLLQRLPKDGTWASYRFEGHQLGNKESSVGIFRMVGTTVEKGQKSRWFEMQVTTNRNGGQDSVLMKFLVREKDFAAGARKMPEILRGWIQIGDKPAIEMNDEMKEGLVSMLFGLRTDVETVKSEKVIKLKKGQLKIATATRGKQTMQLPEAKPGVMADFTVTTWSDKTSPFGTAVWSILVKTGEKTVYESTATLQDHGTGAKSALPDNK